MTQTEDFTDLLHGIGSDDLDDFAIDDEGEVTKDERDWTEGYGDHGLLSFHDTGTSDAHPINIGFQTAGGKIVPKPSAAAIARAHKLFEEDIEEIESSFKKRRIDGNVSSLFSTAGGKPVPPPSIQAMQRAAAIFAEDAATVTNDTPADLPSDPAPSPEPDLSSPQLAPAAAFSSAASLTSQLTPLAKQSILPVSASSRAKALAILDDANTASTPSKPKSSAFRSPLPRTPLQTTTNIPASKRPEATTKETIRRSNMHTPISNRPKAKRFVTPFKTPALLQSVKPSPPRTPAARDISVFDLTSPSHRHTMRQAFLKPQFYNPAELLGMGLPDELWMLNLHNACEYTFIAEDASLLDSKAALRVLLRENCRLATTKWVDNHWAQVLWKLAGQVQAQPQLFDEKWNWGEVIEQMKYRYEREILAAHKPIVKQIQEHDASPSSSMVLCVSAIHSADHFVYLELTDGWYRILAETDQCLTKAVNRGRIAVGRKLSVAGAKLESGSDGTEALDALDKSRLKVTGNSCHLARWDARLGLSQPFLATLSSISRDGGMISLMGIVVERVFPTAFVSGDRDDNTGPWNEEEEAVRQDRWKEAYLSELNLRHEMHMRQIAPLQQFVQQLETIAAESEAIEESSGDVDRLFEEIYTSRDYGSRLRQLSGSQIITMAAYGRSRLAGEIEDGRREVEQEVQNLCPPPRSREFRTIRFSDLVTGIRPPFRDGMLTVWDSGRVDLKEGNKYLVSSLYPSKSGDWSIPKTEGAKKQIYLHTRRDTRWNHVA